MIDFSIIVPCYNEFENIPELLSIFLEQAESKNIEVIFVNNGSTDGSGDLLEKLLSRYNKENLKVVHIEHNIGYGHGIVTGLSKAQGKWLGYTHGDLQTDPKDVFSAIDLIKKSSNERILVKGSRKNRKFNHRFFSRSLEFVCYLILGVKLYEINAQPNIFHRELFFKLKNPPMHWGLDLYLYYIATKNNFEIKRIDVLFPERKFGNSKWNSGFWSKMKFSFNFLKYCLQLRKERC